MATTQQEFKDAALEIKTEFADFFVSREFVVSGNYDPLLGTTDDTIANIDCLREEYAASEIDGQKIQRNDFKLLVIDDDSAINLNVDNLSVTVDGKKCSVINSMVDAANAVWTLQVRG